MAILIAEARNIRHLAMARTGILLPTEFSARSELVFESKRLFSLCLLICIVCLALRAYYTPLPWLDEAFTLLLADVPPPISSYLSYVYDRHGPGYFTLLSVVHEATGSHFFTYYHSYLLLGLLLVLMLWPRIGSFDRRDRLLAASLFLVMPYVLHMANEMRMYVFQATLAWGIWLCLVGHYERRRSKVLLGLALLLALIAAYAHILGFLIGFSALGFFAVAARGGTPATPNRGSDHAYRRDAMLFTAAYLVLAVPAIANFLLRAWRQFTGVDDAPLPGTGDAHPSVIDGIQVVGVLLLDSRGFAAGLLATCALAVVIALAIGTAGRPPSAVRRAGSAGFVLLPAVAVALLGLLGVESAPRAGFYALPFVALTIAELLRSVRGRLQGTLTAGIALILASLSLYQAATVRASQDYRALARYLATAQGEQPIGFLNVVDLWMVAREMGAGDIAPERFFKSLTELGPVARSGSLHSFLDAVGLTRVFAWKRVSAIDAGGRELRLVGPGEWASWAYDTPIVSSWGVWMPPEPSTWCEVSHAGFVLFLKHELCAR